MKLRNFGCLGILLILLSVFKTPSQADMLPYPGTRRSDGMSLEERRAISELRERAEHQKQLTPLKKKKAKADASKLGASGDNNKNKVHTTNTPTK